MLAGRTLRDRPFRDHWIVYLLGPIPDATVEALPGAFARLVERNAFGVFGRGRPPAVLPLTVAERRRRAAAATIRVEAADDLALIRAAVGRRAAGLPVGLVLAPGRAAFTVSHALGDGSEGVGMLGALLTEAAGEPTQPVPKPVAFPLVRAAIAAGRPGFRHYLERRRAAPPPPQRVLVDVPAPAPPADGRLGVFRRVSLSAGDLAALRRRQGARGGRSTAATRAASLALEVLAAVDTGEGDPRVILPIDLRPELGGARVAGNFIASEPSSTLHGGDWRPGALSRMLADQRAVAVPLLAVAVTKPLRSLPSRRPQTSRELVVAISVQSLPPLPAPASAATLGVAALGSWPSTPTVAVLLLGNTASLSFWDDTGRFDLDRVEQEIRLRVAP